MSVIISKHSIKKKIKSITKLNVSHECYPEIIRLMDVVLEKLIKNSERVALIQKRKTISLGDIIISEGQIFKDEDL